MQTLLRLFLFISIIFYSLQASSQPAYWIRLLDGLELCDIQTADAKMLVLTFRSEQLENDNAITPSSNTTDYTINGENPLQAGRYTSTIFRYHNIYKNPDTGNWFTTEERYMPELVQHKIYLQLQENLVEGQTYSIHFPTGDTSFVFSKQTTFCESVKVNQVGYNARANQRKAFFRIWAGDIGGLNITGNQEFEVYNALTHELVFSDSFSSEFLEADDGANNTYVLDLAPLTDTGEYYIALPGIGRSYTFGFGNKWAYHLYYVHMKGLYQQRCGMALEESYTQWTRESCHPNMYIMDVDPSQDKITVPDELTPVASIGGHHDAADFDQRAYHQIVPAWLLSAYEYAPERMKDGDLNIPESGNNIPDIIDEALWNIKRWELLQTEEGGIRGGIETSGHPTYGAINAERDNYKYGTYRVQGFATLMGAGIMANAARLLETYDSDRATQLQENALKAWTYYENHEDDTLFNNEDFIAGTEWSPGPLMYAGLQLYLLTGEEKYHTVFKDTYADLVADIYSVYGWPVGYQQHYYNGNTMYQGAPLTFHFVSYMLDTAHTKDAAIVENIKTTIINKAEDYLNQIEENGSAYGYMYTDGWGMGSGAGRWGDVFMWAYKITGEQKYLDAASLCADFVLGANHMGICMTTGMGERPPYDPLTDSFDHIMQGKGPFPGVPIYYYGGANSSEINNCYPSYMDLPFYRRYIDSWIHIGKNEYTITETMAPNIFMYAALMSENDYKGAVIPFGDPSVFPGGHYQDLKNTVVENTWTPQAVVQEGTSPSVDTLSRIEGLEKTNVSIAVFPVPANTTVHFNIENNRSKTDITIRIYSLNNILIDQLVITDQAQWNVENVAPGIYYYEALDENQKLSDGKIVVYQ